MAKQAVRLTAKQLAEHRDMQVRGEALGMAAQYCGAGPNRIDDVIRGADKIYAFLKDRAVPAEPKPDDERPERLS